MLVAPHQPDDDGLGLPPTSEYFTAMEAAFDFDMMRSLKGGLPFLMMESTPGSANWHMSSPQKERGLAMLATSGVLMLLGIVWMRKIIRIEI